MTLLSKDQIAKMSLPEIAKEVTKQTKQANTLKTQLKTMQSQDHSNYKNARKNIARLMTAKRTLELQENK